MDTESILLRLRQHEAELRRLGVAHAALFGSRARGDAGADSDTDILIELDSEARVGVYEYIGIQEFIAALFQGPVHVANRDSLKSFILPAALYDAIYAF